MKKHKRSLNRSITKGCSFFIVLLFILLSLANVSLYRKSVFEDYQAYIEDILMFTLEHIDADDLGKCIETGVESEKYKESLNFMDDILNHFHDIHYFYAILPLNTNETGNTMSVFSAERYYDRYVDTEGNLYLGWISDTEFDAETARKFLDVLHGDEIVFFEERTEWGMDYTGAVAIKDTLGKPVAVLAVDVETTFISQMIVRYALVNVGIISVLGLVFVAMFIFWSRKNITVPIGKLEQSAVHFADHSHGQRDVSSLTFEAPKMEEDNEIKALSDAVVKMTDDIRNYISDIVSAEENAANMRELANKDALTGVGNKTAYDREFKLMKEKIENGNHRVALAVVDLNFLKKINDTYGHDKGNFAIKKLCSMICSIFSYSKVFRIGGDEFIIVLKGSDYDRCDSLYETFWTNIEQMAADDTLEPWERISAAIGVAYFNPEIDDSIDSLFRRADDIMYEVKKEMKAERID